MYDSALHIFHGQASCSLNKGVNLRDEPFDKEGSVLLGELCFSNTLPSNPKCIKNTKYFTIYSKKKYLNYSTSFKDCKIQWLFYDDFWLKFTYCF